MTIGDVPGRVRAGCSMPRRLGVLSAEGASVADLRHQVRCAWRRKTTAEKLVAQPTRPISRSVRLPRELRPTASTCATARRHHRGRFHTQSPPRPRRRRPAPRVDGDHHHRAARGDHLFVAVRAFASCDAASPVATATTTTTQQKFVVLHGCFIATAAYGAPMAADVDGSPPARPRSLPNPLGSLPSPPTSASRRRWPARSPATSGCGAPSRRSLPVFEPGRRPRRWRAPATGITCARDQGTHDSWR